MHPTYKTAVIGTSLTACALLAALLILLAADPGLLVSNLAPAFILAIAGFSVLIFSPVTRETASSETKPAGAFQWAVACTRKLGLAQSGAIAAIGFFAGAVISQILKLT